MSHRFGRPITPFVWRKKWEETLSLKPRFYPLPTSLYVFIYRSIGRVKPNAMAITSFKSPAAQIQLIPWDPESPDHVERMIQQRIACGWKHDKIEGYRKLQREGKVALQWVVSVKWAITWSCSFLQGIGRWRSRPGKKARKTPYGVPCREWSPCWFGNLAGWKDSNTTSTTKDVYPSGSHCAGYGIRDWKV